MSNKYYSFVSAKAAIISDSWETIERLMDDSSYRKLKKFVTLDEAHKFLLEYLAVKDCEKFGINEQPPQINALYKPTHTFR